MLTWRWYWSLKLCKPAYDEWVSGCWMAYLYSACHGKTYLHAISMLMASQRAWCCCCCCCCTHTMTEWERRSRLGSALFNRMIADAGRGVGVSPALSGWWGFCSCAQHSISALLWHVKCEHVQGSEAATTPLCSARGNFQEFVLIYRGDTFAWDNICQTWCIALDPGDDMDSVNISKQASFRCLTALKTRQLRLIYSEQQNGSRLKALLNSIYHMNSESNESLKVRE